MAYGECDITDGDYGHHVHCRVYNFGRIGEQSEEVSAEYHYKYSAYSGHYQAEFQTLASTYLNAIQPARAYILTRISSHGHAEREVRHHSEAIDAHYHGSTGYHKRAEAVGKGLNHYHGHGEYRLSKAGRQTKLADARSNGPGKL